MQLLPFKTWLKNHPRPQHIAVLTGAGISAESGIPTFRGADGLWRGMDPADLFTPEALRGQPGVVWEMYDELRGLIARAEPNAAHRALAEYAEKSPLTLITQNIDGLHQRAGSRGALELHGTLWQLRCEGCGFREDNDTTPLPQLPPLCPRCQAVLRPDIVLFTEPLPVGVFEAAAQAARSCDLMMVVGTSCVVYPAAGLPAMAMSHEATVVEINPGETALSARADFSLRGPAVEFVPRIIDALYD